jgi:hypothetical protein
MRSIIEASPRIANFRGSGRAELTMGSSSDRRGVLRVITMGRHEPVAAGLGEVTAADVAAGHVKLDISWLD